MANISTNATINVSVKGQQAITQLNASVKKLQSDFSGLGNILKGLAVGTVITNVNKLNQAMVQASNATGVTVDTVAAFAKAVSNAGGDANRAAGDVIDFVAGLTAAKQGSIEAQQELAAVGITLQDLGNLSNEDLFKKTVEGLAQIQDASLRNQLAVKLLGKSFKDADIQGVAASFQKLSGSMNADAIKASAAAQANMAKQMANLTAALTNVLTPLNKMVSSIDISVKTFESLIRTLALVGSAFLIFTRVLPAIQTFSSFVAATSGVMGFFGRQISMIIGHFVKFGQHLLRSVGLLATAYGGIQSFGFALAQLARGFARLFGVVGIIWAIVEAINFLTNLLFDFDIIDWVIDKFKALYAVAAKFFGFDTSKNETKKQTEELKKKTEEYGKVVDKAGAEARASLEKIKNSYSQLNTEQLRTIQNEIDLVGLGEDLATIKQASAEAEKNYLGQINELMTKYQELQASAAASAPFSKERAEFEAFKSVFQQGMVDITKAYEDQIPAVIALAKAKNDAVAADKLRLFGIEQEQKAFDDLRAIQDEIAKSTMSEIEKKYYDIKSAADKAALSAIRAEEARRGSALSTSEVEKYYEKAYQGAEKLKKANKDLYEQSRQFSTGWKKAMSEYVDNAFNAARNAENLFNKFFSGVEDMIVEFVKTGEFNWKSFVSMMLEELLRIQLKQVFASLLGGINELLGAQGGLIGGILGDLMNVFGGGGQSKGGSATNPMYVYDVSNGGGAIGGAVGSVLGEGQQQGGGLIGTVVNGVKSVAGGIGKAIGGVVDTVGSVIGGVADTVGSIFSGGGGGGGSLLSDIGDFFGGWFANGGTLGAGKWGIAGENGPELISGPASVTPMGVGGTTNVYYTINAVDTRSFQQLLASDPSLIYALTQQGAKSVGGRR